MSEGRLSKWRQLLHEMTPRDLAVLQAYYRIEPWGDERADLREATMAAVLAYAFCGSEVEPHKLANYLGNEPDDEPVSPNAVAAMMRGAFPGAR